MSDTPINLHRYRIGDVVKLRANKRQFGTPSGEYKIVRLMPAEGEDLQYRVKDKADWREYVVPESQLS